MLSRPIPLNNRVELIGVFKAGVLTQCPEMVVLKTPTHEEKKMHSS